MVAWPRRKTGKCSLGSVECVEIALSAVTPGSLRVWHKANAVDSIAVVKSIHLDHTVFIGKASSEFYIQVWIAPGAPVQCQLEDAPLLDMCCIVCKHHPCRSYQ